MSSLIDKYRCCGESKEILRILQKSSFSQENMIWQNIAGKRLIVSVFHLEIDFSARDIVLLSEEGFSLIDSTAPVYVKLDYHSTVFKVSQFHIAGNQLSFEIPKEVRTPEYRTEARLEFEMEDEKVITVSPYLNHESSIVPEYRLLVKDISKFGLGLLVSELDKSLIKKNRILWITGMGGKKLQAPLLAEVVYVSSDFYSNKDKLYKFGLKLSKKFSPQLLRSFLH